MLNREERKLLHHKSKQPTLGRGKPDNKEGFEGDISYRKIQGSGTVQYIKQDGSWVAMSSSGKFPPSRSIVKSSGSSEGVTVHLKLNGLSSDDHEQYVLVDGTRAFGGNWTNAGRTIADLGIVTTADINGGTIDGVTLGTNSAVTQAVVDNINLNGATIGHTDDTDLMTLADGSVTFTGSTVIPTADINGGTIDGTTIGASSHTTIKGTTIDATTDFTIGGLVITDGAIDDSGTLTIDGASGVNIQEHGTNVINIDTDRYIYFHAYGQTLFQKYAINNSSDKYHFTSGKADYKQNLSFICHEFSSTSFNNYS